MSAQAERWTSPSAPVDLRLVEPVHPHQHLVAEVIRPLGAGLRSLVLFGSCLSKETRRPGSIPDLFAVVEDLQAALSSLGISRAARWIARWLPPATLSLRSAQGVPLAKLNLIEAGSLSAALLARRDLYLAGRLGKYTEPIYLRDAQCSAELDRLLAGARDVISRVALLGLRRRVPLETVLRRCVGLSYEAEPRPERASKIASLYDAFSGWYEAQYAPLLIERARELGMIVDGAALLDPRPEDERLAEAQALATLLNRSRLRAIARWPKGMLMYRGWLPYIVGKIRRARAIQA